MGMAASQAQLLSITAQMHDIERKAQTIQNRKIELATQKDDLYQKYCDALDAKKIQVAMPDITTGKMTYVDANFNNVCNYQEGRNVQYALRDAKTNKVIVSQDVYDMYYGSDEDFAYSNDKYSFAWAMLDYDGQFCFEDFENKDGFCVGTWQESDNEAGEEFITMTQAEELVYRNHESELAGSYDTLQQAIEGGNSGEINDALGKFRDELYRKFSAEILEYMNVGKDIIYDEEEFILSDYQDEPWNPDFDQNEFNYYVRLFEEIQASGGCETIDSLAEDGDTGKDWFNSMVNSGRVLIDFYNTNNPQKGWTETSVATSTTQNYLQKIHDDSKDQIAEAEYEHELGLINAKDKRFDQELSNLETKRSALKTQQDALKTIIDDNQGRTFGIFS